MSPAKLVSALEEDSVPLFMIIGLPTVPALAPLAATRLPPLLMVIVPPGPALVGPWIRTVPALMVNPPVKLFVKLESNRAPVPALVKLFAEPLLTMPARVSVLLLTVTEGLPLR